MSDVWGIVSDASAARCLYSGEVVDMAISFDLVYCRCVFVGGCVFDAIKKTLVVVYIASTTLATTSTTLATTYN